MDVKILDETKFSEHQINDMRHRNKLATKEKNKMELKTECSELKNALETLINEDYYQAISRNEEPDVLYSKNKFSFKFVKNNADANFHCGINFPKVSEELSSRMHANITVTFKPIYKTDTYHRIILYKRLNWFW